MAQNFMDQACKLIEVVRLTEAINRETLNRNEFYITVNHTSFQISGLVLKGGIYLNSNNSQLKFDNIEHLNTQITMYINLSDIELVNCDNDIDTYTIKTNNDVEFNITMI